MVGEKIILTSEERLRFTAWLRQEAEDSVEKLFRCPSTNAMSNVYAQRLDSFRVTEAWLNGLDFIDGRPS